MNPKKKRELPESFRRNAELVKSGQKPEKRKTVPKKPTNKKEG